jgi:hypothetical protein
LLAFSLLGAQCEESSGGPDQNTSDESGFAGEMGDAHSGSGSGGGQADGRLPEAGNDSRRDPDAEHGGTSGTGFAGLGGAGFMGDSEGPAGSGLGGTGVGGAAAFGGGAGTGCGGDGCAGRGAAGGFIGGTGGAAGLGSDGCVRAGCSSELCVDESQGDFASDCLWREEFACLQMAPCERQPDGSCGHTPSAELDSCVQGAGGQLCPPCVPPPSPECVGSGPCGCGPYTCPNP